MLQTKRHRGGLSIQSLSPCASGRRRSHPSCEANTTVLRSWSTGYFSRAQTQEGEEDASCPY